MQLASRFASRSPALRSDYPLSDDQIRRVAPSIFAEAPHESRSERYSYIPTAAVLTDPQHPYTRKLMAAVPVADPGHRRQRARLATDEIPSPVRALGDEPAPLQLHEVAPGHFVAAA